MDAEATIRANAFETVEDLLDARLSEEDLKDLGACCVHCTARRGHVTLEQRSVTVAFVATCD
jgi:hypothetical protein